MFGAGDRMARHQMGTGGKRGFDRANNLFLDRSDIGHDRAGGKMRAHRGCCCSINADGNGQDYQIGAGNRITKGCVDTIGDPELLRGCAHIDVGVVGGNMAGMAAGFERTRQRSGRCRRSRHVRIAGYQSFFSRNSFNASRTAVISSRVPIDMRTQSGRP